MVIEYNNSVEDYVALSLHPAIQDPIYYKQYRRGFILLASLSTLVVICIFFLVPLLLKGRLITTDYIPPVILLILMGTLYYFTFQNSYEIALEKNVQRLFKKDPKLQESKRVELTPTALLGQTATSQSTSSWSDVTGIASEAERLFLILGPGRAIIVPRRAFPDEATFQTFAATAKSYYEMSRTS